MKKLKAFQIAIIVAFLLLPSLAFAGSQATSSTTAATIITYARYYLNEPSENVWEDTELLQWVNHGTLDIVTRSQALQFTEDITLVEDQIAYDITSDYIFIMAATYDGTKGLIRGNPQSIGNQFTQSGEPNAYFIWNDDIYIYPIADATAAGNIVKIFGLTRPAAVLSGGNVLVPAHYDKALIYYVVAQALTKIGQYNKANYFTALYTNELDRYRMDYNVFIKEPVGISK